MQNLIYNVQRYSLHDGDGIRTVIFFKGCYLKCKWCCNPESQSAVKELAYIKSKCISCGKCKTCDKISADYACRNNCSNNFKCADLCPSKALKIYGEELSLEEIIARAERDEIFYNHGGGITLSGGEPLMQGEFIIDLLREFKRIRINTAIETCGFGDYKILSGAAEFLDLIMYDIKCIDENLHELYTGKSNKLILENIEKLSRDFPNLKKIIRTPVIPEFNDSKSELENIAKFAKSISNSSYETLQYHKYGVSKYESLGRKYEL